jgi:hypothetical protein
VQPEDLAEALPHGPDPAKYVEQAKKYLDAGLDHLYFHQIGRDQEGFLRFWQDELRPRLEAL